MSNYKTDKNVMFVGPWHVGPWATARGVYSMLAMKQLASFASLGWLKMMQILTLGEILYIDIDLCGMSILRLFKFFLLAEVWTITPKFCNCQTYECYQCIIANIFKCSLSYIFILTSVFCCCKPCILNTTSSVPAVHSSSKCTKIGIFGKVDSFGLHC